MKDNKLIMFALLPLIVISFLSIMLGDNFIGISAERVSVDVYDSRAFTFNLDPLIIGLEVLIVVAVACAILGIKIVGSGLSDVSIRVLTVGICYTALWSFLSLLAYSLIISIEIFGITLYLVLTVIFTLGVITKMVGD